MRSVGAMSARRSAVERETSAALLHAAFPKRDDGQVPAVRSDADLGPILALSLLNGCGIVAHDAVTEFAGKVPPPHALLGKSDPAASNRFCGRRLLVAHRDCCLAYLAEDAKSNSGPPKVAETCSEEAHP